MEENYYTEGRPKINITQVINEQKLLLDEEDKKRIDKNIKKLEKDNIPYSKDMKIIPTNSSTELVSKNEIIEKLLFEYVVAKLSENILNNCENEEFIEQIEKKNFLTEENKRFIEFIKENELSERQLKNLSNLYEDCAVYLWALGLISKPTSEKENGKRKIDNAILELENYNELLEKAEVISKSKIMEFADLVFRYDWACNDFVEFYVTELNNDVVQEQKKVLEWILNWRIESVLENIISVDYQHEDLDFKFNIPSTFKYQENKPSFLTFTDEAQKRIVCFTDEGECDEEEFDNLYKSRIKTYEDSRWDIMSEATLDLSNFKTNVKQVILNNAINEGIVGIAKYYFLLNGHCITLETLLEKDLDCSSAELIQKSENNNIAINILASIVEKNLEQE